MKSIRGTHLVIVIAALVLGYALLNYSSTKSLVSEAMDNSAKNVSGAVALTPTTPAGVCGNAYQPSSPLGQNSGPASAQGVSTSTQGLPTFVCPTPYCESIGITSQR